MGDLALVLGSGNMDLALVDDDLASDEGLRTAVLLSLFTDRRAAEGDELPGDPEDLRGWWADEFAEVPGDLHGSRLWLLARTKVTEDLAGRVEEIDREALAWLIEDGVADQIDVEIDLVGDRLYHLITIQRPTREPVTFKFSHVWDGEAARGDG